MRWKHQKRRYPRLLFSIETKTGGKDKKSTLSRIQDNKKGVLHRERGLPGSQAITCKQKKKRGQAAEERKTQVKSVREVTKNLGGNVGDKEANTNRKRGKLPKSSIRDRKNYRRNILRRDGPTARRKSGKPISSKKTTKGENAEIEASGGPAGSAK